jgi:chromosome segregation ATPase
LDVEKLNKDLANKNERIQSLQNKLANNEKNIADVNKTDNEKIAELNKKSLTLKNFIDKFKTDIQTINLDIEKKQNEIKVLDKKIKLSIDTNIGELKTQINNIGYSDELSLIIGSIFNSLFETLYGKDIANKIIKNST